MKYIKGKGYFVGSFSETDIKNGLDRVAVEKAKTETGLQYTNQEYIKKRWNTCRNKIVCM